MPANTQVYSVHISPGLAAWLNLIRSFISLLGYTDISIMMNIPLHCMGEAPAAID